MKYTYLFYIFCVLVLTFALSCAFRNAPLVDNSDCENELFRHHWDLISPLKRDLLSVNIIHFIMRKKNNKYSLSYNLLNENPRLRKSLMDMEKELIVDCLLNGEKIEYLYCTSYDEQFQGSKETQSLVQKNVKIMIDSFNIGSSITVRHIDWLPKKY